MLHWLNGAMTQLCIIKHLDGGRCEYLSCFSKQHQVIYFVLFSQYTTHTQHTIGSYSVIANPPVDESKEREINSGDKFGLKDIQSFLQLLRSASTRKQKFSLIG